MYIYQNDKFSNYADFFKKYDLTSIGYASRICQTSYKKIMKYLKEYNIPVETVLLEPSKKKHYFLTKENFDKLKNIYITEYKNDDIPSGYLTIKELAELYQIKPSCFKAMVNYYKDCNKYANFYYKDNIRTKFFLFTKDTQAFFNEKIKLFTMPLNQRKLLEKKQSIKNPITELNETYYLNGNHHKIRIDYQAMSMIFDTKSTYYKELLNVYKKAALRLNDYNSERMDAHHIIPRFLKDYKYLEDLDNIIYVEKNIHLLIHILEYKCALQPYKQKLFSAMCILTMRTDTDMLNDCAFNAIINALLKSLNIY